MVPVRFLTVFLASLGVAACTASVHPAAPSDSDASTPLDGGSSDDAPDGADAFTTADHQGAPTVKSVGGPVLKAPKIMLVTFGDDPLASQVETFAGTLGASSYWSAITSEYGVGALTLAGKLRLPAPATKLTTDDIETWLIGQLDGTHPEWGTPDTSTVYTLVYPKGTSITLDGNPLCKSSPAYHYEVQLANGTRVPYVLIGRCDPAHGLSGIDYLTAGLSHELVEASTDPFFVSNPAFSIEPDAFEAWFMVTHGEVADMCTISDSVYFKPEGFPFTVERSWSNAAASAGKDPCVPAVGPYFNAAPRLPDTLNAKYMGQRIKPQGVKIPMGQTQTIEVDLFSETSDVGDIQVNAWPLTRGALTLSWDKETGQNGDKLQLSVTRNGDDTNAVGIAVFVVEATVGTQVNAWIGAVGD